MNPDATLYRLRPQVVEARQVIAEDWERVEHIAAWCGVVTVNRDDYLAGHADYVMWVQTPSNDWESVEDGDWVVKNGSRFARVTPEDFERNYEPLMRGRL